jgi:hypothetical protein
MDEAEYLMDLADGLRRHLHTTRTKQHYATMDIHDFSYSPAHYQQQIHACQTYLCHIEQRLAELGICYLPALNP